jgi:hypothetical protein
MSASIRVMVASETAPGLRDRRFPHDGLPTATDELACRGTSLPWRVQHGRTMARAHGTGIMWAFFSRRLRMWLFFALGAPVLS